ncbi:hypothetical protein niasHS_017719 [Heterodera schachtii]|uniref:SAP domain-containing protein n=1 Tax=Heterodera schachtii TaxID=97005 RepID=A0ABD2I5G0_HETSC
MTEESEEYCLGGRPLSDLKVVELRKELEIRSLPKSGNKKELVERLQNFLRDEKSEQTTGGEAHQVQKTAPTTELNQSPSGVSVPNVVAQYLAQQQIQLQAARRSADKIRADTSLDDSAEIMPISSPTEEIQPSIEQQKEEESQDQIKQSSESAPELVNSDVKEPSVEKTEESAELQKGADQHLEVETDKSLEEERTNTEEKEGSGDGSTSEKEREIKKEERTEEKTTEPTKDEEERSSRTEGTQGDQQIEVKAESDEDETEKPVETVNRTETVDTHAEEMSPDKSAKARSSVVEEELDFENEEDDEEEREEPADDGGKRRAHLKQGSPVTMKSFEHKLGPEHMEQKVTDVISTSETVAVSESEVGPLVGQLTASIKEESSKPPEGQQETTPEGFIRRRPSSPARHPPSRWVHIRNLKRPFTKAALFDLLGKFGTVDTTHFWMDSIKSTCIATYETDEQAQLARERLHNVVWPVASDLALCVEFSTEEKLNRRKAEEEQEASANNSALGGGLGLTIVVDNRGRGPETVPNSGPTVLIQHDKKRQKDAENRKRKVEELEKSQKTLDEVFKKTKTLPAIYFLPLSDEEAVKRRKKLSVDKQQSQQHSAPESHRNSGGNLSRDRPSASGGTSRRSGGGGESGGRSRQSRR